MEDPQWFVGVDWGPTLHTVCVQDASGQVIEELEVAHEAEAVRAFIDALVARAGGAPTQVAIGIERPDGALVAQLIARDLTVYAINPRQLDRFRDRFTLAGAKDDRRDAWVLAASVRTDRAAFRTVQLPPPLVVQLREWSRIDDDLGQELTRLTHQLRDLIYRVSPGLLQLSPGADDPWLWALWAAAPTPAQQARLADRRLAQLLQRHRIRRFAAADLRDVLRRPALAPAPGVIEAVAAHSRLLLSRIELVATQRGESRRTLQQLLETLDTRASAHDQREHSDVAILRSLPGVGIRVAARMLTDAWQPLVERGYHTLRAQLGVAPVTKQSSRRRSVVMRYACNPRLRDAAYHWARTGIQKDPASRAYYDALRARGHSHGRALRSVTDRSLRILCVLLTRGQLFDPLHKSRAAVVAA